MLKEPHEVEEVKMVSDMVIVVVLILEEEAQKVSMPKEVAEGVYKE